MGMTVKSWEIIYLLYVYEFNEEPFSLKDLYGYWGNKQAELDPEDFIGLGLDIIKMMDDKKDLSYIHNLLELSKKATN